MNVKPSLSLSLLTSQFRRGRKPTPGFTIVELLIVIVIVAILASITIVAYNGIQDRAKNAQMTTGASQYAKALTSYAIKNNGKYPTTALGCFDGTINCWASANQAASTALFNAVKSEMSNAPLILPYVILLQYDSAGPSWYILFQIKAASCPNIGGVTFLTGGDNAGNGLINCRYTLLQVS